MLQDSSTKVKLLRNNAGTTDKVLQEPQPTLACEQTTIPLGAGLVSGLVASQRPLLRLAVPSSPLGFRYP